jgi:predicted aspartyl protease
MQLEVVNHEDTIKAKSGILAPGEVRRARLSGVVDTGATRLVLPGDVVEALGLPPAGRIQVRFADGREGERDIVGPVLVEIAGRASVFMAVVEPGRKDALIGAIVLEELDLIPDCTRLTLVPRDPRGLHAEIECCAAE